MQGSEGEKRSGDLGLKRQRISTIDMNLLVVGHVGAGKSSFLRTMLDTLPIKNIRNIHTGYTGGGAEGEFLLRVDSAESADSTSHRSWNTAREDMPAPKEPDDISALLPVDNKKGIYTAPYRWVVSCSPTERVSLLVVDSQGIPAPVRGSTKERLASLMSHAKEILQQIMNFLEVKFEITLLEESKVKRNPRGPDHKIHACIYMLDPHVCLESNGLTSIDVYALKKICAATNVILCLGKADSISIMDLGNIRKKICEDIVLNEIPVYSFENNDEADNINDNQSYDQSNRSDADGTSNRGYSDPSVQALSQHLSYSNAALNSSIHSGGPLVAIDDTLPVQKYNFSIPFTILNSETIGPDYYSSMDILNKCNTTVIEQLDIPVCKHDDLKTQILSSSLCKDNSSREKLDMNKSSVSFSRSSLKPPKGDDTSASSAGNHTYLNVINEFSGRIYPWGVLYCDNPDHCDLLRIKQILLCTHTRELIFLSKVSCYEQWRTAKLLEIRNSLIQTSKYPANNSIPVIDGDPIPSKHHNDSHSSSKMKDIVSPDGSRLTTASANSTDNVSFYKAGLVDNKM